MSKGSVVFVGDLKYEAEVLTSLTEESAFNFAQVELWDFASARWVWDEKKEGYTANSLKDRRERSLFNSLYKKVAVVLAADKNSAFESVGALFELARDNAADFEKVYHLAIKANPTLEPKSPEVPKEKEGEPADPLV